MKSCIIFLVFIHSMCLSQVSSQTSESMYLPKKMSGHFVVGRFVEVFSDGAIIYTNLVQRGEVPFKFTLKTSVSIFDREFKELVKADPKDKIAKADKKTLKSALNDFQVLATEFAIKNKFLVVYVDWDSKPLVYQFTGTSKQIEKDVDKIFKSLDSALLAGAASIKLSTTTLPEEGRDAIYDNIPGRNFVEF